MHHKQGERSHVEFHIARQAALYCNAATQDAWLAQAILRRAARRDDIDVAVAVRTGQHTGGSANSRQKPNILFIMGDDIGWMQPRIYHRGLMVGETPNIDRIGNEGAMFMDYVAMQSCTSGRNAFFTGMYPLRTGMIPPQLPGQPVLSAARHAGARQVPDRSRLQHRRIRQEPSGRPHCGLADGAWLPGVLGLPLPPRRDAAGELP